MADSIPIPELVTVLVDMCGEMEYPDELKYDL